VIVIEILKEFSCLLIARNEITFFSALTHCLLAECVPRAQEPEFTDKSVAANKEYQYRVTAENEGGESKPSEPSDLIKAKALKGKSYVFVLGLYCELWIAIPESQSSVP